MMVSSIILLSYFMFLLISGQKLNGLMVGVSMAAGPIYLLFRASGEKLKLGRWSFRVIALMGVVLAVSSIGFGAREISQKRGGAIDGIIYRAFALQGEVYYTADKRVMEGHTESSTSMLFGDMDQTIRVLTPAGLANAYIHAGVNLAGSLPGTAALVTGFAGAFVICVIYGIIVGLACAFFAILMLSGRVFDLFLASYIYIWCISVYARGSFDELFSVKFVLFALGLFLIRYVVTSKPLRKVRLPGGFLARRPQPMGNQS
jgi:hypothetical protein